MQILSLPNGRLSVEFAARYWPGIKVRLKRFGPVEARPAADLLLLKVGSAKLVRTEDWDGAALIATNEAGDRVIRSLAARWRFGVRAERAVRHVTPPRQSIGRRPRFSRTAVAAHIDD